MTEFQTRQEFSRSLESAEQYKALQTLTELGLFHMVSELDLSHGRAARPGEPWQVEPSFHNGGDRTGNLNVHARTTLYTGAEEDARDFATARVREKVRTDPNLEVQVHDIVARDADARVLDMTFDPSKLDTESHKKYVAALRTVMPKTSEGAPVDFKDKDQYVALFAEVHSYRRSKQLPFFGYTDINDEAFNGYDKGLVQHVASVYNVGRCMEINPTKIAQTMLLNESNVADIKVMDSNNQPVDVPVNLEYAARFFEQNHVVGVRQMMNSATLGRTVETYSMFDLSRVNTPEFYQEKRAKIAAKLGRFVHLESIAGKESIENHELVRVLVEDAHAKPERLIELAKKVPGFEDRFDMDSGVWERYTLGEHTETVLRMFDESLADNLPVALLAPMRLALLVHDIGKPLGSRDYQKDNNQIEAQRFMNELGVTERTQTLILGMIGEGSEYVFRRDIRGEDVEDAFNTHAIQVLRKMYGEDMVLTIDMIKSYRLLCKMLQACDGGAYTSMAVTRREVGGKQFYFRNNPSFNGSFMRSVRPTRRSIDPRPPVPLRRSEFTAV